MRKKRKIKNSARVEKIAMRTKAAPKQRRTEVYALRMKAAAVIFILAFLGIAAKALTLQLGDNKRIEKLAQRQHTRVIKLTPQRGTIYDSGGSPLAVSVEVKSVYAEPRRIKHKHKTAKILAELLGMKKKTILKKLKKNRAFVWIKRKIDDATAAEIKELHLKGIGLLPESKRFYPNGTLAANVIGFTGVDANGLGGLELKYDGLLLNPSFVIRGMRDARGRIMLTDPFVVRARRRSRHNLYLSIDKTIQYIAERELDAAVKRYGALGGSVIVSEPHTGRILAMASRPTFDPNNLSQSRPSDRRNRATARAYEPGSTFKPLLVAASLQEGTVSTADKFFCKEGTFKVAGRAIHDSSRRDWLDLYGILKFSSNIGAAKLGMLLGKKRFYKYIKALGFGEKTELAFPGETRGLVRPVEAWTPVDLATISFGQGIAVSPLQMLMAFNAVINGGLLMAPILVDKVVDDKGTVTAKAEPKIIRRVFSSEVSATVRELLRGVTEPGGTGHKAALVNFSVAGKTGTSQKVDPSTGKYSEEHYVSSFVGFAPVENPRISMLVTIDEPQGRITAGGRVAAPVFGRVAERILTYLHVPADGKKNKKIRLASIKRGIKKRRTKKSSKKIFPNLRGLTVREVVRFCKEHHIQCDIRGSGFLMDQLPPPGKPISTVKTAKLTFKAEGVL